VAEELELDASTRSTRLPLSYSALAIETLSVATGLIVSVAVRVVPLALAEIVAEVLAVTLVVETVNVALVCPAATVTLAGTVAAAVPLESATAVPPAGAAEVSVMVPVDELPPVTDVGLHASVETAAVGPPNGCTVSVVVRVMPAPDAVIVTSVDTAGGCVLIITLPLTPKIGIRA
jgi:hypothetical protein